MDLRRAIVDDVPLHLIDDAFLLELRSGATMDYLVGKCLNLFTDYICHQPNDSYYDIDVLTEQVASRHPNLTQLRIMDGEHYVNVDTGLYMNACTWQPSSNIVYCEQLIYEHKINISFFEYDKRIVTASTEYVYNDKKYFIEIDAPSISEAVCKVVIGKHCNICSIEVD